MHNLRVTVLARYPIIVLSCYRVILNNFDPRIQLSGLLSAGSLYKYKLQNLRRKIIAGL
jgi:hypothetical protein